MRKQLIATLLNSSDEENPIEEDSNLEIHDIESSSEESSNSEAECNCNSQTDYYKAILEANGLSINVLSKDEQNILDSIDKIKDAPIKRKMIEYYLSTFKKEKEESHLPSYEPYSLKKVLDEMKEINSSSIEKVSTILDLKGEINLLKKEIQEIKNHLSLLETSSSISPPSIPEKENQNLFNLIDHVTFQKW